MQTNDFYLFLAVKYVKVSRLEWAQTWHVALPTTKFQTDISKRVLKSPENFPLAASSTNAPFQVFLSTRGLKITQPWRKSVGIKTLTL